MAVVPFSQLVRGTVEHYSIIVWLLLLVVTLGLVSYWLIHSTVRRAVAAVVVDDPANYPQSPADTNEATVYFFHVDWCGYCTKAQPIWKNFVTVFDGRVKNGFRVKCISLNVTGPGGKGVDPALAQQYNLKQYPTVKIVCDGKVTLLDANVTDDSLRSFLQDVTKRAAPPIG